MKKRCKVHRWNLEDWGFPFIDGGWDTKFEDWPEDHPAFAARELRCIVCGRVLEIQHTSNNVRLSIASGIANRIEEYGLLDKNGDPAMLTDSARRDIETHVLQCLYAMIDGWKKDNEVKPESIDAFQSLSDRPWVGNAMNTGNVLEVFGPGRKIRMPDQLSKDE